MGFRNAHFAESTWPMDNTCLRRVIIYLWSSVAVITIYEHPWPVITIYGHPWFGRTGCFTKMYTLMKSAITLVILIVELRTWRHWKTEEILHNMCDNEPHRRSIHLASPQRKRRKKSTKTWLYVHKGRELEQQKAGPKRWNKQAWATNSR